MTTSARTRKGERRVELYVPLEGLGPQPIESITFKAVTLDQVLRWQSGEINGVLALASELSNLQEPFLRQITYPDAQFVMDEFMAHIPETIRASIAEGRMPVYVGPTPIAGEDDRPQQVAEEAGPQYQGQADPQEPQSHPLGFAGFSGIGPDDGS